MSETKPVTPRARQRRTSGLLEDLEDDDPILSVVNLIDVFLVLVAALLLVVSQNPLNPFNDDKLTVIRRAGQPDMEIVIKDGQKIDRYKATDGQGAGAGVKAGMLYRMHDGGMVYVPE
ncbi:DUF2149 domain-containing protein [uncultured Aquabacterium sp.]|uniref:DUF2149 domain-containing protein n=1 Tax=uncultured Aquabacterium sp. TaxID=158753 RepID=UPI0025FBAF4E|nr:DUF2149 domain-containing protein [uncultured Aquabacterium sp.]